MPARRALAAVVLALCTSCAGTSPAPAADADRLGLSAVAVYGRHAAVRGKVDVRLINDGRAPVEVASLQLRTPLYETVPALQRASMLPPDGEPGVVPVPFGSARCEAADARGADVLLAVRTAEGVVDVPVPLTDGDPGLVRDHRLACASTAVSDVVELSLGPALVRDDSSQPPRLRTTLRAERRSSGRVEVTQLSRNILFGGDVPEQAPLLSLDAQEPADAVDVVLTATRAIRTCSPRARRASRSRSSPACPEARRWRRRSR